MTMRRDQVSADPIAYRCRILVPAWPGSRRPGSPSRPTSKASRVPEGLWVKCPSCGRAIYNKELVDDAAGLPEVRASLPDVRGRRLRMLFDGGAWTEHDADLRSLDPLKFTDTKPYRARLEASIKATGLNDAVIVGSGTLDGAARRDRRDGVQLHRRQHGRRRRREDHARRRARARDRGRRSSWSRARAARG